MKIFRFETMIETGSPVTIFTMDEIKKITRRKDLQVGGMIEGGKYVEFKGKSKSPKSLGLRDM